MSQDPTLFQKAMKPLIYALLLFTGVQLGVFLQKRTAHPQITGIYSSKLDEILGYIQSNYADTLSTEALENKTINQLLSHLDPHSMYIPKADYDAVNEPLRGNFEGIGVEFHIMNDTIMVVNPIVGGPSEQQGIKAGDKIISINDTLVAGKGIKNEDVLKKLRGPKGSKVKLSILRAQQNTLLPFFIIRDKIPLHSVEVAYMVSPGLGYIKINSFGANTYDEFKEKVSMLQAKGMKKLLIDLRQNGGGYLDASIQIADELIGGNPLLVYTQGAHYPRQDYTASHQGLFETGKVGIIIDEGSASASEILSGAIQDLDRGIIIGRRSFGKGLVMSDIPLSDGSSLRLSMARYYTPSGRCVQKPYTDDIFAYETEIFERYLPTHAQKDSAEKSKPTEVFKTKSGRIVKGGGGIYPDVPVALDTNYNIAAFAALRNDIPEFVYQQMPQLKNVLSAYPDAAAFNQSFQVGPSLFDAFKNHLSKQKNPSAAQADLLSNKLKIVIKAYIARQLWNNEGYYRVINDMDKTFETAVQQLK